MQYLQAAVAVYGAALFGWQGCLISSTQNLPCLFHRLSHPGLSSLLHPAAALQGSEAAGGTKLGWMSTCNKKEIKFLLMKRNFNKKAALCFVHYGESE